MKYCYIVTEGPHDIEFLAKLIKKSFDLSRIKKRSLVDSFWDELIPKTFPIHDDLLKRVPVPLFLQNNEYSIALHNAIGISNIVNTLEESLSVIDQSKLFSVALILDADETETPLERFQALEEELSHKLSFKNFHSLQLGQVINSKPKFGIFVLPDNQNQGTLESILIECAETNYPYLLKLAESYISNFSYINNLAQEKLKSELKDFHKPAGKNKAIISTISSVLKPGKAIQVSIQDNKWINEESLQLPSMILIKQFINDLIC